MSDLNMDATLPVPCQNCGHKVEQTLARLKTDPVITCPKCGVATKYDAEGLRKGLESAQKSIDDLRRSLKKLS
jgi:DNA-directed RNA polymerase subunit RPC12/RpoP